jgi:SNF family Na+-dependent transporter
MNGTVSREIWATRIGLVLAMAGNAVGLGNFLRFPVQAAQNGGGTFMIPYFISFLLLGIPLMWVEWGIGRYGGLHGHGSTPGMFDVMTDRKRPWAKYLGALGLVMPLVVFAYYTLVVSWMLAMSFNSLTGAYFGLREVDDMRVFLASHQDLTNATHATGPVTVAFFLLTFLLVAWVLRRGVQHGIEKLALIAMPLLFLFAFVLMIRVLTLPPAVASAADGLNFIWQPNWSALGDARVWLAAAGQIFFTLSVGMGTIHTYASYLSEKDDITLTGLSTAATNEFAEVVLGGTIAIPAAVVFFGITGATAIAMGGSFDLGIVAMGVVFQGLPGPQILAQFLAFLWFFLLFIAGITSSVAQASPAIAFLQDEFGWRRHKAALSVALFGGGFALFHLVFFRFGVLDEWDYWAGTFGLVVLAAAEIFLFSWVFGITRGWDELHRGADLQIPRIFRPIIRWVTPLFLLVLLVWWGVQDAWPTLMMRGVTDEASVPYRWAARILMLGILLLTLWLIRKAWQRRAALGGAS